MGWTGGKSRCYKVIENMTESMSFDEADVACNKELEGSSLAQPLNDISHGDIKTLVEAKDAAEKYWIGMHQELYFIEQTERFN